VKSGEIVFKLLVAPLDELNFEFDELLKVAARRASHDSLRTLNPKTLNYGVRRRVQKKTAPSAGECELYHYYPPPFGLRLKRVIE
jgi:hypothetical protein